MKLDEGTTDEAFLLGGGWGGWGIGSGNVTTVEVSPKKFQTLYLFSSVSRY